MKDKELDHAATHSASATAEGPASAGSIFRRYGKRLMSFIRSRVKSMEDAEDILQDVFVQVSNSMALLQQDDRLTSWLFTVTRNSIIDNYRKKRAVSMSFNETEAEQDEEAGLDEVRELLMSSEDNPETDYLKKMIWQELNRALEDLPPEQREVFILNELEGVPFKELSERTGEGVNTLISRKRYAVLYLRGRLRGLYEELINF